MALITCPECGKAVSTEAKACPSCGYPVAEKRATAQAPLAGPVEPTADPNVPLLEVRPSWWNYGWHLFFFFLIVPLCIALYRRYSFLLRVYPDRLTFVEGFWSKESSEFFIRDIRSVDVRQGFWDRMVDIGDVLVSTAATIEASESAPGVPDPHRIKEMLISLRQQALGEYIVPSAG
jgi:membrane protein YdbS with pleckstrin-like domain